MKRASVRVITILLVAIQASGCSLSFQRWQYNSATRLVERKQYRAAVDKLTRVVRRGPDHPIALAAAREGSRLAVYETRDYSKAAEFYRHLVLYSPDVNERMAAQESLAEIYFDKLLNYDQAVIELNRLLPLVDGRKRSRYQLIIARAHLNLNNFAQALIEVDDLLRHPLDSELKFESLLFKGNILQAARRLDEAIAVFNQLLKEFPARASRENVGMSLSICHEEKGDLKAAIETLEMIKPGHENPDFIQIRITRLKERLTLMPGAQGLRR